jgi:hypothetical protein
MTTTEEIVVCGEDFIERRIFVCPGDEDIGNMQKLAYGSGYEGVLASVEGW